MGRPYFAWELKYKGEHKRNEALKLPKMMRNSEYKCLTLYVHRLHQRIVQKKILPG